MVIMQRAIKTSAKLASAYPAIICRTLQTSAKLAYSSTPASTPSKISLQNFDPKNYNIPLRFATMDDLMEPYGSWKTAYEAEKSNANKTLALGILSISTAFCIMVLSGCMDGLYMPNLDNIMEETEPYEFEKEGRKFV